MLQVLQLRLPFGSGPNSLKVFARGDNSAVKQSISRVCHPISQRCFSVCPKVIDNAKARHHFNVSQLQAVALQIEVETKEMFKLMSETKRPPKGLTVHEALVLREEKMAYLKNWEEFWTNKIGETELKSFKEADRKWTQRVTGINIDYRHLDPYLPTGIHPLRGFQKQYIEAANYVHMENEGGRRFVLNLFLLDIVKRPEFNGRLKIFPNVLMDAAQSTNDGEIQLTGIVDYIIGSYPDGLEAFDVGAPEGIHFIATEASVKWRTEDFWRCVAEAATLFKTKKDAGETDCSVWGVASNAKNWQFIHIDNCGLMWRSSELSLNLGIFPKDEVTKIYRFLYVAVNSCFKANCKREDEKNNSASEC
ncbi:hypothetical protein BDR26DRAFT_334014 [Obelidium mucronatum]|nr:hypothetical protein BDR26DRAFT_334014 [Obelidium mucronatum]